LHKRKSFWGYQTFRRRY